MVTVFQNKNPPPMDSDVESDSGDSELGAVGEGSGEESTPLSGERRPRARRVRVAHRCLEPIGTCKMTGKEGVDKYNFCWTSTHAFQMVV